MYAILIPLIPIALAASYFLLIMPRLHNPNHSRFLNWYYAHRGFYNNDSDSPENSLAAFQKAVERGYGIELDVQLTKDSIPVVFHDFDLKRMCGLSQKVRDLTLAELRQLVLLNTTESIPTLSEALRIIRGQVPLIIELKSNACNTVLPRIVNFVLTQYDGDYCIESFNPIVLSWYRHHRPDITRGQLSTNYLRDLGYTNPLLFSLEKLLCNAISRPDFISYNWRYRRESSRRICRNLYHTLSVGWTIRSREELELCQQDFDLFIFEGFTPEYKESA